MSRLESLHAEAASPDHTVFARIEGRSDVSVWMAPGHYASVGASGLASQLSGLARLLFAERMRAYYAVRSADFGRTVTKEPPMLGRRDESYARARSAVSVTGRDATGRVVLTSTGMSAWSVDLAPDTLAVLDEREFCAAVGEAASALVRAQFAAIRALKTEIYG